jgi:hypothetical protein
MKSPTDELLLYCYDLLADDTVGLTQGAKAELGRMIRAVENHVNGGQR